MSPRHLPGVPLPGRGEADPGAQLFVEAVLVSSIIRGLSEPEMGECRRPTLTSPREIPVEGQPADVAEIVEG